MSLSALVWDAPSLVKAAHTTPSLESLRSHQSLVSPVLAPIIVAANGTLLGSGVAEAGGGA